MRVTFCFGGGGISAPSGGVLRYSWHHKPGTDVLEFVRELEPGTTKRLAVELRKPRTGIEYPVLTVTLFTNVDIRVGGVTRRGVVQAGACHYDVAAQIRAVQGGQIEETVSIRHSTSDLPDSAWPTLTIRFGDDLEHSSGIIDTEHRREHQGHIEELRTYAEECTEAMSRMNTSSKTMHWCTGGVEVAGHTVPQQAMVVYASDFRGVDHAVVADQLRWMTTLALIEYVPYEKGSFDFYAELVRRITCDYAVNHVYKLDTTEQWRLLTSFGKHADDMFYDCEDGALYATRVIHAIRECRGAFTDDTEEDIILAGIARLLENYTPVQCTGVLISEGCESFHEFCILLDRAFASGESKRITHPTVRLESTAMNAATLTAQDRSGPCIMAPWPSHTRGAVHAWHSPLEVAPPDNPESCYREVFQCYSADWHGRGMCGAAVFVNGTGHTQTYGTRLQRLMEAHTKDGDLDFSLVPLHPAGTTPEEVLDAIDAFIEELPRPQALQSCPAPSRRAAYKARLPKGKPGDKFYWARYSDYALSESQTRMFDKDAHAHGCVEAQVVQWTQHSKLVVFVHPSSEH